MFKKILVPTDGSENAHKAVRTAAEFLKSHKANDVQVTVIFVFNRPIGTSQSTLPPSYVSEAGYKQFKEAYQKVFEKETQEHSRKALELLAETEAEASALYPIGDPGTEIVKHAQKRNYDLIIMGTRGSEGFSSWVLGSVAQKVISRAPCPVMLVR